MFDTNKKISMIKSIILLLEKITESSSVYDCCGCLWRNFSILEVNKLRGKWHTVALNGKTSEDGDAALFDMGAIYHFRGAQHCNIYNEA